MGRLRRSGAAVNVVVGTQLGFPSVADLPTERTRTLQTPSVARHIANHLNTENQVVAWVLRRLARTGRVAGPRLVIGGLVLLLGLFGSLPAVTGARSASPPPWLTFGGAGQNWDAADRAATVTLSNFTWWQGGCSRTRVRARRPPRYHRHRGPDQGFPDRTTPDRCPG